MNLNRDHERVARMQEKLTRELGPIVGKALAEPDVIEILLNPDGSLWVERVGSPMEHAGTMRPEMAESLIATVAASLKTVVSRENPILEAELPVDGSRFEALLPPIVTHPTFSIRKRAATIFTLENYVQRGTMTFEQRERLIQAVRNRENVIVSGGTGTGKTTLTNALIETIAQETPDHRLVIIEDTAELRSAAANTVFLRSTVNVDMLKLLRATMRLRPDRIIVGETRGAEALALLKAWNTGHAGGVSTIHANNAAAALVRLEQLVAEATEAPMQALIAEAVDLVVAVERIPGGRRISEILEVSGFRSADGYLTRAVA